MVREVRGVDERHGTPIEPGAAGREAARAAVRRVPVLAHDPLHQLARLGRDVGPAVHDARDGRDRDAGGLRDLADRRAARPVAGLGATAMTVIEACSGTIRKLSRGRLSDRALDFAQCQLCNTFRKRFRNHSGRLRFARPRARKDCRCDVTFAPTPGGYGLVLVALTAVAALVGERVGTRGDRRSRHGLPHVPGHDRARAIPRSSELQPLHRDRPAERRLRARRLLRAADHQPVAGGGHTYPWLAKSWKW